MVAPSEFDTYAKAGYGELWDTLAEHCEFPPSFEVFSHGLFRHPQVDPERYTQILATHYHRTVC